MNNDKFKKYFKPLYWLGAVATFLLVWYRFTDSILEKVLILYIGVTIGVPLTIGMLGTLLQLASNPNQQKIRRKVPKERDAEYICSQMRKRKDSNKTEQKENKSKLTKVNKSEYYPILRTLIINASKNKMLDREHILIIKDEIYKRLGNHANIYKDNFNFANDLNEIYVLIKSNALVDNDYLYLLNFVEETIERKDEVTIMEQNVFEVMEKYLPKEYWDDMMFMGEKDNIYLYKHYMTRRYANIDSEGNFYIYNGNGYSLVDKTTAVKHLIS